MEPLGVEDDGFSALKKSISVSIAMNSFRLAGTYWAPSMFQGLCSVLHAGKINMNLVLILSSGSYFPGRSWWCVTSARETKGVKLAFV